MCVFENSTKSMKSRHNVWKIRSTRVGIFDIRNVGIFDIRNVVMKKTRASVPEIQPSDS
jgi:hypothetical protein